MKFHRVAIASALVILAASEARALPVTLNAGESAFFNFDLTGAVPGPIYDEIRVETNVSDYDGDELGLWNVYRDFGPPPGFFVGSGPLTAAVISSSDTGVVDGVFAIQLVLLAGSGSLTVDPYAVGVITEGGQEVATDAVGPVGVPEPTTLALFGAGLVALSFRRRSAPSHSTVDRIMVTRSST